MRPVVVLFYFCDSNDERRSTATAIVRSLLRRLLKERPKLFKHMKDDYEGNLDNLPYLWSFLRRMLNDPERKISQVYLVIDALDECHRSSRNALLRHLGDESSNLDAKILISCRPNQDIQIPANSRHLSIDSATISDDLARVIQARVGELSKFSDRLKAKVAKVLLNSAGATFLWATLVIEDLKRVSPEDFGHEVKDSRIEERIQRSIPGSLNEVYDKILNQIDPENQERVKIILSCVVTARRPLTIDELTMAYALASKKWTRKNMPSKDFLDERRHTYKLCEPLVYVDSKWRVNLVHQSAREYLLSNYLRVNYFSSNSRLKPFIIFRLAGLSLILCADIYTMDGNFRLAVIVSSLVVLALTIPIVVEVPSKLRHLEPFNFIFLGLRHILGVLSMITSISRYHIDQNEAHFQMFYICWQFLVMAPFKQETEEVSDRPSSPFRYAAEEWQEHALAASKAVLVHPTWVAENLHNKPILRDTWLLAASERGQLKVVELLAKNGASLITRDSQGCTPLALAAGNGYDLLVKWLLDTQMVDLNCKSNSSQTPLSFAAAKGHNTVVMQLLAMDDIDVDSKDQYRRSPLWYAAAYRQEAVLQLLVTIPDVDPNFCDVKFGTALSWAAKEGNDVVIELLLGATNIDPNSIDITRYHLAPLSWAAWYGHKRAVRQLLTAKGIEPNYQDHFGQTPLSFAAANGHNEVVEQLLATDSIDPDLKDRFGQTPLLLAAANGHRVVVKQLLTRSDVNPNSKDNKDGWTPLSWAVVNGHDAVVKLLLDNDSVDPDTKDNCGRTALSLAVESRQSLLTELTLNNDVNNYSDDMRLGLPLTTQTLYASSSVSHNAICDGCDKVRAILSYVN